MSGEDPEIERERPFLSGRRLKVLQYVFMHSTPLPCIDTHSRYRSATSPPPFEDGEHNALEGEEGEEGHDESASSTGFVVTTLWL
jgi:hypothetical protein